MTKGDERDTQLHSHSMPWLDVEILRKYHLYDAEMQLKKGCMYFGFLQQKSLSVSATLYHLESAFSSIACARHLSTPEKALAGREARW